MLNASWCPTSYSLIENMEPRAHWVLKRALILMLIKNQNLVAFILLSSQMTVLTVDCHSPDVHLGKGLRKQEGGKKVIACIFSSGILSLQYMWKLDYFFSLVKIYFHFLFFDCSVLKKERIIADVISSVLYFKFPFIQLLETQRNRPSV